jgi:thiol:disulfide interchange protein
VQAVVVYLRDNPPIIAEPAGTAIARPSSLHETAGQAVAVKAEWAGPRQLVVHLKIKDGYHISAHEASAALTATQLAITTNDAPAIISIDYPAGEIQQLAFSQEAIHVYTGDVRINVQFAADVSPALPIGLALSYQACTDTQCLPLATQQFEVGK